MDATITKLVMIIILMATVCLCVMSLALQANGDDCVHPPVHQVVPMNDYIRSIAESSMHECAAECKLLPHCLSFAFDEEQRTCQLRGKTEPSFTVGSGILFSDIQPWKMATTGACNQTFCGPHSRCIVGRYGQPICDESSPRMGMNCAQDADCHSSMMSCLSGRCLCKPGYIHNIGSNSCDRGCKTYGDTWKWYPGLGILQHNTKSVGVRGEREHAMNMCMLACVQETSFICKTIEFSSTFVSFCYLSDVGYFDVGIEERFPGEKLWVFGVRGCQ